MAKRKNGMDLRGRHAVVTGAGTGIGRAIALRLAGRGASLTLLGRRLAPLRATAEAALGLGAEGALARSADVRDAAALQRACAAGARAHGPVWAVVANSGVGGPNAPGDGDRFDELVATNLSGAYHTLRAAQRHFAADGKEADAGHAVVISSILARIGVQGYTGYCASKAGLLGLVRALAMELAPRGVQVNAVCPGWVDTEMAWQGIEGMAKGLGISREEAYALAMQDVPLGRMSRPEDVAGLVSWLLSPDARGVTGQALDVNNGAWMG
jgi:NAD(P)-dependent dehydrogenase (short-subunit alcohol dehydrogenase family)